MSLKGKLSPPSHYVGHWKDRKYFQRSEDDLREVVQQNKVLRLPMPYLEAFMRSLYLIVIEKGFTDILHRALQFRCRPWVLDWLIFERERNYHSTICFCSAKYILCQKPEWTKYLGLWINAECSHLPKKKINLWQSTNRKFYKIISVIIY